MTNLLRIRFNRFQWIVLAILAILALGSLWATTNIVGGGVVDMIFPSATPTPRFVFPATWTPAPTPTMIVPTQRVP